MPRKTRGGDYDAAVGCVASMRPRPDATENGLCKELDLVSHRASMRPRPDATENPLSTQRLMRRMQASMRPRPDATENACIALTTAPRPPAGFNEAAARCHGKLNGTDRAVVIDWSLQ